MKTFLFQYFNCWNHLQDKGAESLSGLMLFCQPAVSGMNAEVWMCSVVLQEELLRSPQIHKSVDKHFS